MQLLQCINIYAIIMLDFRPWRPCVKIAMEAVLGKGAQSCLFLLLFCIVGGEDT